MIELTLFILTVSIFSGLVGHIVGLLNSGGRFDRHAIEERNARTLIQLRVCNISDSAAMICADYPKAIWYGQSVVFATRVDQLFGNLENQAQTRFDYSAKLDVAFAAFESKALQQHVDKLIGELQTAAGCSNGVCTTEFKPSKRVG